MAIGSTTLALIAAGAALAGSGLAASGAMRQGSAASSAADFQARVLQQQAEQERRIVASSERDFRRDQSRLMAQRRAALGGSGVEGASGSPLLVSEDFAAETELQAQRIRQGGEITANRLRDRAALVRAEGDSARSAGVLSATGSLLSGIGRSALVFRPEFNTAVE